jgi:hypothetical protein
VVLSCAGGRVIAQTNTSTAQSVAVATRSTLVELAVVNFLVLLKHGAIRSIRLHVDFLRRTNALLRPNRTLIAVALPDHILFARSELEQILIVLGLGFVDDRRRFFLLLGAIYEEHGAENLAEIGCEVGLELVGHASDANEEAVKEVFG